MKIALAQINPTIGDIAGNAELIRHDLRLAAEEGARLVVFPELAIIGYPPKDLLLKPAVIERCVATVNELATCCTGIAAIIGYPCPSDRSEGRSLYNAAAVCAGGRVQSRHVKSLLPTYDVFDEQRYFEPGPPVDLTALDLSAGAESSDSGNRAGGLRLGISICEDLWNDDRVFSRLLYHDNPIRSLAQQGAGLFVNCSASPFVMGKHDFRLNLMASTARQHQLPLLYCNQVGGNDELVFDGNSCAFDQEGQLIGHAKDFESDLLMVEVHTEPLRARAPRRSRTVQRIESHKVGIESAYHALVLGLRDYCRKCGFASVVLGLSGGIDSAVTCALSVAALGRGQVRGISMPSRYSSDGSMSDAQELAERLGIPFHTVTIEQAHQAFEQMLGPHFEGRAADATEENVQARIRGIILMSMSNKFGSLLVTTGNKSELAVGYCTLYGDMAGGLAVLSDVPKTVVYQLGRWINTDPGSPLRAQYKGPVIPEASITKPPSAELRENQTDQESLPDYEVLDQIIERYVEREQSARQIIDQTGFDQDVVLRMIRLIDLNEYKRKQAAPGLKITGRAFGFGRRMPIAHRHVPIG